MNAREIATKAAELVGGDREKQHGEKRDNFERIASVWNGYLSSRREPGAPLDAVDVGHLMVLMKIARTQAGAFNMDDYVDACGYAACAGEIAANELFPDVVVNGKAVDFEYASPRLLDGKPAVFKVGDYVRTNVGFAARVEYVDASGRLFLRFDDASETDIEPRYAEPWTPRVGDKVECALHENCWCGVGQVDCLVGTTLVDVQWLGWGRLDRTLIDYIRPYIPKN